MWVPLPPLLPAMHIRLVACLPACLPACLYAVQQLIQMLLGCLTGFPMLAADVPKRDICSLTLDDSKVEDFTEAVKRHYWYEQPVWSWRAAWHEAAPAAAVAFGAVLLAGGRTRALADGWCAPCWCAGMSCLWTIYPSGALLARHQSR